MTLIWGRRPKLETSPVGPQANTGLAVEALSVSCKLLYSSYKGFNWICWSSEISTTNYKCSEMRYNNRILNEQIEQWIMLKLFFKILSYVTLSYWKFLFDDFDVVERRNMYKSMSFLVDGLLMTWNRCRIVLLDFPYHGIIYRPTSTSLYNFDKSVQARCYLDIFDNRIIGF